MRQFGKAVDVGRLKNITALMLNDLLAFLQGRHRQLENHLKTPDIRRVDACSGVGQPKCGHLILFQHSVEPCFVELDDAAFSSARPSLSEGVNEGVLAGEHILHLIEQKHNAAFVAQMLRRAVGAQTMHPRNGVAVFILIGHIEQLAVQAVGQRFGQLGLPGARRAEDENVHPLAPLFDGGFHERPQHRQFLLDMRVVIQTQNSRSAGDDATAQQGYRVRA